ncbi:MAG: hypothetical protein ACK4GN_15095 [Runella sp.]
MLLRFIVFLCFVSFFSCSAPPDQVGDLDLVQWRADKKGCQNIRKTLLKDFEKIEPRLLGEHIDKVGHWLGKPDFHQLARRDQKLYVYFLEQGPQCQDITQKSSAAKVILRFNAVGLLTEVMYE